VESIVNFLWNPFLSLWYLVIGGLIVLVTGAVAWRHSFGEVVRVWRAPQRPTSIHFISHEQALIAALAAGVGVGNLAGVATALHLGGPGALFWMWVSAVIGMSLRMASTYFACVYRPKDRRSKLFATPMSYLVRGLPSGMQGIAAVFALLLLVKGVVAANLVQSNSVAHAFSASLGVSHLTVAIALSAAVAIVILGGLQSIVRASVLIAPVMLVAYVVAGGVALGTQPAAALKSLASIFEYAFQPYAIGAGGAGYAVLRTMQYGVSRGVFSHASGIGVAPFLHAANDGRPSHSAHIAALVPVVDTLLICTVTGLVILTYGDHQHLTGAHLTVSSFERALGGTGRVLIIACLVLFAFTTIVNWAHFGERCFEYLGGRQLITFRLTFVGVTFLGPFFPVVTVWWLGDLLIGLLLFVHLVPLLYLTVRHLPSMLAELTPGDREAQSGPRASEARQGAAPQ
jgi:alanine or glycine:cation symporter, AGCS family